VVERQKLEVGSLRDGVATDLLWSWVGSLLGPARISQINITACGCFFIAHVIGPVHCIHTTFYIVYTFTYMIYIFIYLYIEYYIN
jgi:hypothetical protein